MFVITRINNYTRQRNILYKIYINKPMNIIKHILNLPNSAVFGIINHSTKEAFISHSKELKSRIGAIIESLPESLHNGELVIFSSIGNDEYKLLHAQNVINSLKESGYVIFNSKEYINYKPKIIADPFTKTVFVMLVNKLLLGRLIMFGKPRSL